LHANSGLARQDETVSGRQAAEPDPAAAGDYAPIDEPAPHRSSASAGRAAEYISSQDYTSGQDHRVMDRRSGPPDGFGGPHDRPARGSLAELGLRLERLPAGHPSSPYEDTGARRAALQQLRQLELPLADEERESDSPARASLLAATAGDRNGAARTQLASPSPSPNGSAQAAATPAPSWKTSQNGAGRPDSLPQPVGSAPVGPAPGDTEVPARNGRADHAGGSGSDWHDPEAGAVGQNGHSGRYATLGDLAAAPSARAVPPVRDTGFDDTDFGDTGIRDAGIRDTEGYDTGGFDAGSYDTGSFDSRSFDTGSYDTGSYGTGSYDTGSYDTGSLDRAGRNPASAEAAEPTDGALADRALADGALADHEAADEQPSLGHGPAASAAGQAPADLPAARRGLLTPEQEQIANRALGRYRVADGRNVFGGYGESGLTPAIRRVESHLPHGRLAGDSEDYTLKSPERFKEKLAKMIARSPGVPAEDLAAEIYDAARYTFVFEPQEYTDGTWLVHRRLKAQGFELEARRNRWESPEYKGIRTRWRDPAHDLAFEVQFHTPTSWDVLQRTHEAYMRISDPQTPPDERAQLRARQVAASAATRPPPRCAEIGDFRADTR